VGNVPNRNLRVIDLTKSPTLLGTIDRKLLPSLKSPVKGNSTVSVENRVCLLNIVTKYE
jgi:hypothetical protein